jgi:hypothetical protein
MVAGGRERQKVYVWVCKQRLKFEVANGSRTHFLRAVREVREVTREGLIIYSLS